MLTLNDNILPKMGPLSFRAVIYDHVDALVKNKVPKLPGQISTSPTELSKGAVKQAKVVAEEHLRKVHGGKVAATIAAGAVLAGAAAHFFQKSNGN